MNLMSIIIIFRYYLVNPDKNMLDNLRNRVVVDHPKIIVTIGTECFNMIVSVTSFICVIHKH